MWIAARWSQAAVRAGASWGSSRPPSLDPDVAGSVDHDLGDLRVLEERLQARKERLQVADSARALHSPSLLAEPPVAHVPRQVVGFQVDAPGRERLRAVVGQTDRLVVGQQRELARREHGLPLLTERLARADRAAAPSGSPGQERELGPARGLGERVGGLRLHDAAAHLGRDPRRRLVAQATGRSGCGASGGACARPRLRGGTERSEEIDCVATIGTQRHCRVSANAFSSPAGSSWPTVANAWYSFCTPSS